VHERILHHVLGGRRVVQDVDGDRERGGAVLTVGALERLRVSKVLRYVEKNLDRV
jgi:hypothetical protein